LTTSSSGIILRPIVEGLPPIWSVEVEPYPDDRPPTGPNLRRFGPIVVPQLYEQIAAHLTGLVLSGALQPGERLPAERDLALQLEVSRSSLREAIAELAVEGILETRRGSGSYVSANARERARARAGIATAARAANASPVALLEARMQIEPAIATLAARRAQPDPVAEELLAVMERQRDPESPTARSAWNDADRLFHRQLARMSGNPVMATIADWVAELMDEPLWQRLRDESVAVPGRMRIHMAEHRMIYESIVGGDVEASAFFVRKHIERVRRYMGLE
jgi:DNA-binding FadR family transcriptional regulator